MTLISFSAEISIELLLLTVGGFVVTIERI